MEEMECKYMKYNRDYHIVVIGKGAGRVFSIVLACSVYTLSKIFSWFEYRKVLRFYLHYFAIEGISALV
jgi:hypothetical protein